MCIRDRRWTFAQTLGLAWNRCLSTFQQSLRSLDTSLHRISSTPTESSSASACPSTNSLQQPAWFAKCVSRLPAYEAIVFHLELLRENGQFQPHTYRRSPHSRAALSFPRHHFQW